MAFTPTEEWKFCPECGAGPIEVDVVFNDFYLGDAFRCPNGHGFYAVEADISPPPVRTGPPGPFEEFLLEHQQVLFDNLTRQSILLAELRTRPAGPWGEGGVVVPIVKRDD
jgi:hypothetical protein